MINSEIPIKKIFLDMDGVIVDFMAGYAKDMQISLDPWPKIGVYNIHEVYPQFTKEQVDKVMNNWSFWFNMPIYSWAKGLIKTCKESVGEDNVYLLSSPSCDESAKGKMLWIYEHLPEFRKKVLLGSCKEACASPNHMLIDDLEHNCNTFNAHGGRAVLFPRPWNNLHKLSHVACALVTDDIIMSRKKSK